MNYQEQIKNLEEIRNKWLERKTFFELETVTNDSPSKAFELKKQIQTCNQKLKEIAQEIEIINNNIQKEKDVLKSEIQRNELNIWEQLSQNIKVILIEDEPIKVFITREVTEPVVTFQWKESVIFLLDQLKQKPTQQDNLRTITIDYVINRFLKFNQSEEQAHALAVFVLEYLTEETKKNEVEDETVRSIINYAINNLNKNDGCTYKPSTRIDKAFDKLLHSSYFREICRDQLLQNYILAQGKYRIKIGAFFLYTLNNIELLNSNNSPQKLYPILEKLTRSIIIKERIEAGLILVNEFFLPHLDNSVQEINFLPDDILQLTIKVLFKVLEEDVTENNNAVSTTVMWALRWLTASGGRSSNYTVYRFTEKELNLLRKFAMNKKQDVWARGSTVLILSRCNFNDYEKSVFAQADWIYEWAVVADGAKPQKQLPRIAPLNRPQDTVVLKHLIKSDLPIEGKRSVAIALGRLGCFIEDMIQPLIIIFQDDMATSDDRDEALVYLSFIGNSKVISKLRERAEEPMITDTKKYDLSGRCFLAFIGIGNLEELQYQLFYSNKEQMVIDSYAYALAGITNPQGLDFLNSLKRHETKRIRDAVNNALSKVKEWNRNNSNSNNSSTNYEDQFLARQGHLIHKLKAKDSTGRWAYYFVYVEPRNEKAFLNALESNQSIDLEDYGKVVGSCYGEKPDNKLRKLLKEKYGFEV